MKKEQWKYKIKSGYTGVSDGSLRNLDLDMGVGQLNLTSAVFGNSFFDLDVGETNITLIGSKDDYTIDAKKGIGNLTVDGESVSNFTGSGNGENNIDISGGVGAINLVFKEEQTK